MNIIFVLNLTKLYKQLKITSENMAKITCIYITRIIYFNILDQPITATCMVRR